jgi:hypothetical protein
MRSRSSRRNIVRLIRGVERELDGIKADPN